jgi:hypothetical protein
MAHDDDHREEFDLSENAAAFDPTEPKASAIAIFGALTIVTLLVTVFGIQFYFDKSMEQQVFVQQLQPEGQDLQVLRTKEDTQLNSYGYIDRQKGAVRLPIERSMELMAKDAAEGKFSYPTNNQPVKTPEQIAAAAAGGAKPAPVPGATPSAPGPPAEHKN